MTVNKTFFKTMAMAVVVFSFTSCDHDQETIGSEIIGEPGFQAQLYEDAEIGVRNVNLEGVQTNNLMLPNNQKLHLLGVKNHNFFGQQKAHLLTQLSLNNTSPTFGEEARLDSVVLSVPYFHTEEERDEQGVPTYELDSIYGGGSIKLEVYESNFYLNMFDPESNFHSAQRYYSDMKEQVENNLGELLYTDENFRPSNSEIVNFVGDGSGNVDTVQLPPQLRIHLPVAYFEEKILDQEGSVNLSNNNNFQNYLRGLYIKTDSQGADGLMMHLNVANSEAGVTLYYSNEEEAEDGEDPEYVANSYKLSFNASQVNLFEQETPAEIPGSLFLRGGQGAIAVVELFTGTDSDDDGVSDELEDLRANEWLINEANLVFKVNRDAMQGSDEPERVYLYNLDQGQLLADYNFDNPESPQNPFNSTANQGHLVPLERDEDGRGIAYKIRITRHVHNILNQGADNVRLGLAVTQNVNIINNSAAKSAQDDNVERVPVGSVVSPEGTVLYGMDAADPEDRPKLKVYYTEPKN